MFVVELYNAELEEGEELIVISLLPKDVTDKKDLITALNLNYLRQLELLV